MIEFESVGKTFRDGTAAVQDLSLTIPSDKITVVVGPSGCGKTTTLRMVNRMLEPTSGKIVWDGTPLKSRRKTTIRRQMGYVIQSGGLFPHRSVIDNIGTVPGLLGWNKDKTRKRSYELLGSVGLDRSMAQRYPAQLSGGQQQRVGVARALAADPLVMLMDEPFSAVDPVVRSELHEFFLGLQRQISKTILLITHDIEEAIKLGDQVVILRVGGRLAQAGTPQQLLDEPADAFVEGFVGRDRGYRSLAFLPASTLELDKVDVVREATSSDSGEPTLVVDGDARPVGWVDGQRPGQVYAIGSTFDPEKDTLRAALDSALTSPFGLAVATSSTTGRYAGVVGAAAILAQVSTARTQTAESISVRAAEAAVVAAPFTSSGPDGTRQTEAGQTEAGSTDSETYERTFQPNRSADDEPAESASGDDLTGDGGAGDEPTKAEAQSEAALDSDAGPGAASVGPDEADQSTMIRDEPISAVPGGSAVPEQTGSDEAADPQAAEQKDSLR